VICICEATDPELGDEEEPEVTSKAETGGT
jgi:hypothetical protein